MEVGVRLAIDGDQRELPSGLRYIAVDDDYFSTIGLPIVRGRSVGRSDTTDSPPVAVVSESLGRLIADGGNPLGRRIVRWPPWQQPPAYLEVIGVVPDLITNVNATKPLTVYQPIAQRPPSSDAGFVLRAAGEPGAAMREVLATARALDPARHSCNA